MHRYDSVGLKRYAFLAAFSILFLVHSCDADSVIYVLYAYSIDRFLCRPKEERKRYYLLWAVTVILSILSAAIIYVPFIEWARLSSRLCHSYQNVLIPGLANLFYASLTGTWRTEYPFDPSYFFIGAGTLCLAALGILGKQAGTYVRRFFMFGIAAPLFFAGVFLFHASGLMKQLSIDPWKPMIVFCFCLSMAAAYGSRVLIEAVRPVWLACLLLCSVIISAFIPAYCRISIKPSCGWNFTVDNLSLQPPLIQCPNFMKNIPFYCRLSKESGSARAVISGGTDNMTAIARLRTFINYAPAYNFRFERALLADGIINKSPDQPYWMNIVRPDASILAIYGVKFMVCLGESYASIGHLDGWKLRQDLSWQGHTVLENMFYRGRAYMIDDYGLYAGQADIIHDSNEKVIISTQADSPLKLVLADLLFPGWHARVDGMPVQQKVFKGCLRSVHLPAGKHTVAWEYIPGLLLSGAWVSVFSILGLFVFILLCV